jgi:N-acetylglucosamine malate deacetylase 2
MSPVASSCETRTNSKTLAESHLSASRLLVLVAHPDDETIGAGVLISDARNVRIIHVTDGSPLNLSDALAAGFTTQSEYADARREEAVRALAKAGLRETAIHGLHFVDQKVAFGLEELTHKVAALIEVYAPELVLTHAYEGGHPDHDSIAFACRMATRIPRPEDKGRTLETRARPQLWEFASYNGRSGQMRTYEFLPCADRTAYRLRLDAHERQRKVEMFDAFRTQARVLKHFLPTQFELFRKAPDYDFTRPPHDGKLFYENFDWGIDGEMWRKLAAQASGNLYLTESR